RALLSTLAGGPSASWRTDARAIASRILPPADWFEGVDRIIVVPDGAIALVPFDVLPLASQLLVERAAVTYSPTAATLLRPAAARRWLAPWKLQLLAFADPVATVGEFDSEAAADRLTASSEEVRHAARELGGRATLHVGPDNRKAFLLDSAER